MAWKFFTKDGAEKSNYGSLTDRGTTFPTTPFDGQEYNYVADATNGVVWRFKYNAGSGSAFKWEFVGGSPIRNTGAPHAVFNSGTAISTGYYHTGSFVTVPRAGDYWLSGDAMIYVNGVASVTFEVIGFQAASFIAGGTYPEGYGEFPSTVVAGYRSEHVGVPALACAASDKVGLAYVGSAPGSTQIWTHTVTVTPIRVS